MGETEGTVVATKLGQIKYVIFSEEGWGNVKMYTFDNKETANRAFTTNFSMPTARILYDVSTPGEGIVEVTTGGIAMPHNTIRAAAKDEFRNIRAAKDKLGAEAAKLISGFAEAQPEA